ncbi:MAG: sigma-70 family RNA polymerase sigma factor [Acidobacteriota bacterium]
MTTQMPRSDPSVTDLLLDWRAGEEGALELLMPRLYRELRRIAQAQIKDEQPGQTLSATDLVHEAYLRLVDADVSWNDRAHFLAVAARVMRRILVDRSRAKARVKRGGSARRVPLDEVHVARLEPATDLLALDRALRDLAELDDRKSQAVELVYFGGLTYDEVATVLEISRATVHRDLRLAKAWLHDRLESSAGSVGA